MSGFGAWILETSLATAILACLAWVGSKIFHQRPAVQHALWCVVLIKFVSPSIYTTTIQSDFAWPFWKEATTETRMVEVNALSSNRLESPPQKMPIGWLLISFWGMGTAWVLFRSLSKLRMLRTIVATSTASPTAFRHEVRRVARKMGVRPPPSLIHSQAASPFLCFVGRLVLIWPTRLTLDTSMRSLRSVIAHELAHLKRRDHWLAWIEMLAIIIWWWNPVFHWVRRNRHDSGEMACDALALQVCPKDRKHFAELFLQLSTESMGSPLEPALHFGARRRTLFERRLKMMLSSNVKCGYSWIGVLAASLLGMVAMPSWTLGQATKQEKQIVVILTDVEDKEAESPTAQDRVAEGPITWRFEVLDKQQEPAAKKATLKTEANTQKLRRAKLKVEPQGPSIQGNRIMLQAVDGGTYLLQVDGNGEVQSESPSDRAEDDVKIASVVEYVPLNFSVQLDSSIVQSDLGLEGHVVVEDVPNDRYAKWWKALEHQLNKIEKRLDSIEGKLKKE